MTSTSVHTMHSAIRILIAAIAIAALTTGCSRFREATGADRDSWTVEKFYSEAKSALNSKRYENAIELYQALEARYPYGPYAEQAQLEIGYAQFKNEQPEAAIAAADRFIRMHPTHPNVDYAYYLKGLVNFAEQHNLIDRLLGGNDLSDRDPRAARESFLAFRELVTRYPNSRYAEDSRQRMTYLLNAMAKHDLHVADYYLRRGAYVAVVNRCKSIVEQYQQTAAVEDALGMMAIAYRRMDMDALAEDTLRVLRQNFPNSPYLAGHDPTSSKRWWLPWPKKNDS